MMTRGRRIVAAVVLAAFAAAFVVGGVSAALRAMRVATGLHVSGAVVAPPPANRDVTAAYMTITSGETDHLIAAHSELVDRIEIHRSIIVGGSARMEHLDKVVLPARRPVVFEPGGLHMMVFGVRNLQPGRTVEVTLQTASGLRVRTPFMVSRSRSALLH